MVLIDLLQEEGRRDLLYLNRNELERHLSEESGNSSLKALKDTTIENYIKTNKQREFANVHENERAFIYHDHQCHPGGHQNYHQNNNNLAKASSESRFADLRPAVC